MHCLKQPSERTIQTADVPLATWPYKQRRMQKVSDQSKTTAPPAALLRRLNVIQTKRRADESAAKDRAIKLLESRVSELETELDYWRQMAKLKEAAP